ncbi:site-2 protease family protein [Bacteriovoracaceae bacterium]|nr:site-2 protease family protein [Bacteriovoracaceae bacterium]
MSDLSILEQGIYRLALVLPGLLLAIVLHEVAHAYVAYRFGDSTAKDEGRITLNPISHLDLVGSVIFPLILIFANLGVYGWAKPVPINQRNFKEYKKSVFWVSFAGPLANFFVMIVCAFFYAVVKGGAFAGMYFSQPLSDMLLQAVQINVVIGTFNLLPFPPLDGSKMLMTFLSYDAQRKYEELSRFSLIIFIILILTGALNYVFYPAFMFAEFVLQIFLKIV